MAEKNYKVNEAIKIVYQAPNAETGLENITAEIILPNDEKDSNFPDVTLVEFADVAGEYHGLFTPDEEGEWEAVIHKPGAEGQVVKRYSVGLHNVHSVGEKASSIQSKVDVLDTEVGIIDTKVTALPDAAEVNAEVDTALADYGVSTKADEDAAHVVTDGKIDALDTKVSSLDTPPMVS